MIYNLLQTLLMIDRSINQIVSKQNKPFHEAGLLIEIQMCSIP